MEEESRTDEKHKNFETIYKPLSQEKSRPQLLKNDTKSAKNNRFFLYFSSLTANMLMFDCGCNMTWTSPALSTLRSSDLEINPLGIPITAVQESWLLALINFGAAIGPLAFGKLPDILGRKKLLTVVTILKIISYVILAFAQNVYLLYVARFLLGLGLGLSFAVMPMFTSEISENSNRGRLASLMGVFLTLGILYTLTVGPLLPLKTFTLSCAVFLAFALICFILILPETPVYLLSKGKRFAAKKALKKLRNMKEEAAEIELALLINSTEEENSSKSKFVDIFKEPSLRKGVVICISLCALQHFSGCMPIMAFIGPIFETTGSQIPSNLSVILVCLIQLVSTIFSSVVIERLGRRSLLLLSSIGTALSLILLGLYFHFKEINSVYINKIFWLPMTSLMLYMVFFSVGLSSVPITIQSEVFPSNVRSVASSFVTINGALVGTMVSFIFPIVMFFWGSAKAFWLFALTTTLGVFFIYFVVPETKGKSISEIQIILGRSKK